MRRNIFAAVVLVVGVVGAAIAIMNPRSLGLEKVARSALGVFSLVLAVWASADLFYRTTSRSRSM